MKISPEERETIEFLGLDLVRCKIIVEKKRYLQVKTLNISAVKFPIKMERIIKRNLVKICSNTGNFKQILKPNLVEKY